MNLSPQGGFVCSICSFVFLLDFAPTASQLHVSAMKLITGLHKSAGHSTQPAIASVNSRASDSSWPTMSTSATQKLILGASQNAVDAANNYTDADVSVDAREGVDTAFRPELAAARDFAENVDEHLEKLTLGDTHIPYTERQFTKVCLKAERPFSFVAIRHIEGLKRNIAIPVFIDESGPLGMIIQDDPADRVCRIIQVSPTAMGACKGLCVGDIIVRTADGALPEILDDGEDGSEASPDNSLLDEIYAEKKLSIPRRKKKARSGFKCWDDDIVCVCNDNDDDTFADDSTFSTAWSEFTRSTRGTFRTEATGYSYFTRDTNGTRGTQGTQGSYGVIAFNADDKPIPWKEYPESKEGKNSKCPAEI